MKLLDARQRTWLVVIVATLTMTVSYIDRTTLAVLSPVVTKALDISETGYGWLTSLFSVAYLIGTPLAGWWIDRRGARRGLTGSVLTWSIVAGLHALVPGFGTLLAFRLALGIAEGPGFPGGAQTVQRMLPAGSQARGFGLLFTGSSIGGMIAPPLATWLYRTAGWRFAFLGTAAIGLSWIPIWLLVTRSAEVRSRLDGPTPIAAASESRASFVTLFREPAMIRGLVGVLAAAPAIGFVSAWGAKYLVRAFSMQQADVGHYLWLPPLALDAGALMFGDLASRLRRPRDTSPRPLLAVAMLLTGSLALLPWTSSPWSAMAIASTSMAGGGAMYTLITAEALSRVARGNVSYAGGILAGAQSLALIISSPLIGLAVKTWGTYDAITILLGAWVVPGAVAWMLWPRARVDQLSPDLRESRDRSSS